MSLLLIGSLLAVHLPDGGILTPTWLAGGFIVAGLMALAGSWRIRDEEIPRVALLTAAFFVATLIHVPVPAGPRAHLLVNGLLGIVLGPRAALAIPLGLFLQAALFGHGGFTTLGVNSCVMGIPALLAWLMFAGFQRIPWIRHKVFRAALVALSVIIVMLTVVYSVVLLATNPISRLESLNLATANEITFQPVTLILSVLTGIVAGWWERRLENKPEFPLGLLIGEISVLATVFLNCLALVYGGTQDWHAWALATVIVHLPLAVVEGVILGFMIGFLVRVKPEVVRWSLPEKRECTASSVS
jgi:cobalt/nickel transport system permease protein